MIKSKQKPDLKKEAEEALTSYILKISNAEQYKNKIKFLSKISDQELYLFLNSLKNDYYYHNNHNSSLLKEFSLSIMIPSKNKDLALKDFLVIQNINPMKHDMEFNQNTLYENYVLLKEHTNEISDRKNDRYYLNWLMVNSIINFQENYFQKIDKNDYQSHSYSLIKKIKHNNDQELKTSTSIYSLKENIFFISDFKQLITCPTDLIVKKIRKSINEINLMNVINIQKELYPLSYVDSDYNRDIITYSNRNWLLNYNVFNDFFFSVYLVNHINNYNPDQIEKILYLMDNLIEQDSNFIIYKIKFVTQHLYHFHFTINNTFIKKDLDIIQKLDEEKRLKCYEMFKNMIMPISYLVTKNEYSINDVNSIYDFLKAI